ncbi:MAG: zf-HC2 domain-containing protein [Gemmatimonadaceae bacterium]
MSDCLNIEMREMLPDLLHGSLDEPTRRGVEQHVAQCAECEAELALLTEARRALSAVPVRAVDIAAIARALPRPAVRQPARARVSPGMLRLAAAVTFVSLGGISVAVARSYFGERETLAVDPVSQPALPPGGVPSSPAAPAGPETPTTAMVVHSVSGTAGISDLHDSELESLMRELESLEAAPSAEPEATPGGRVVAVSVIGS